MFTEPITVSTAQLHLPARRPWSAAIVAWLVYSVSLPLWLLLPWDRGLGSPGGLTVTVGIDVTRIVVAVAFLAVWHLWRPAGFTTAPTWQRLVPALPLLVLPAYQLVVGPGLPHLPLWKIAVLWFGTATVAFGEEGVFRGVVLRALLARGVRTAVFGAAAMFSLMHLINLATGAHPISVVAQLLFTFGMGIGFGAVALATGTIWPLIVIHFLMDVGYVHAAAPDPGPSLDDLLLNGGISVVLGLLSAAYGLWLLHRRTGLLQNLDPRPQTV